MILPRINNSRNTYSTNSFGNRASGQSKGSGISPAFDYFETKKADKDLKEKNINIFDEKKLAELLGTGSGTSISDDKKIDWEADGTMQLTDEQIDYLKSKYDITNMSEQDYYDLMSDLTNMNVLSGDEVKKQHAIPIVAGAWYVPASEGIAEGAGEYSGFCGNLLSNVNLNLENYTYMLLSLNDSNYYYSGQDIHKAKDTLLDQKSVYQKLASIYNLIKRDN